MTSQKTKRAYDVIIVGAGASGSTLGYLLSDKGFDVLVIDKDTFPRTKLCAGAITCKTRKLIEKLFKSSFEKQFSVENSTEDYQIYEKFKEKVFQKSPEPFYFVNRKKYDMELVSLAEKKSCQFLFNDQVVNVKVHENKVLSRSGKLLSGRIIIGADGVNSVVRREIYPQQIYRKNLALAFQIDVPFNKIKMQHQMTTPKLFLSEVKWGYGWIFPHQDHCVVGLCGLVRKNKNLKNRYINFLDKVSELERGKRSIIRSHLVPFGNFIESPGIKNILLVGDAAGLVDPLTGEGIYYAHKSAELASKAILDFFNSDESINPLNSYKYYLKPIYRELRISRRLRDIAYSHLRYFAYLFVKSPRAYFKLAEIIHGIKNYSQIPFILR